jgi:hypothetical protein
MIYELLAVLFIIFHTIKSYMKSEKKIAISVTLSRESMDFLAKKVESGEFASFSHGVDLAVKLMARGERPQ